MAGDRGQMCYEMSRLYATPNILGALTSVRKPMENPYHTQP